jgi:hypothetical protein
VQKTSRCEGPCFRQIGAKSDSTPYLSHVDARLVPACLQENLTVFDVVRWGLLTSMQRTVSILGIVGRISWPLCCSVSFSGSQNGAPLRLAPVLCDILTTMAITICSAWLKLLLEVVPAQAGWRGWQCGVRKISYPASRPLPK